MADPRETDVHAVVAEQSALRRVATLVARDPAEHEVFESVTEESAKVLGAQVSSLVRFDSRDGLTVGGWSAPGYAHPPVPIRIALDGDTAVPTVSRTGAPARLRDVKTIPGEVADMLGRAGASALIDGLEAGLQEHGPHQQVECSAGCRAAAVGLEHGQAGEPARRRRGRTARRYRRRARAITAERVTGARC